MTPRRKSPTRSTTIRWCAVALLAATASCASTGGDEVSQSVPETSDELDPSEAGSDTAVHTSEHLPMVEVDWTAHRLELPATVGPDVWLSHVSTSDARTVAIGFAWNIAPLIQTVISWSSVDGEQWARSEMALPPGAAMHQVVALDGAIYGLGQQTNADGAEPLLWTMNDDGSWDSADLSSSGTDLSGVALLSAASNANGIVLGAERSSNARGSIVSFDTGGLRFELNDLAGTYELTDIESGRVVSAGQYADIFRWNNEGQAIYDSATGEVLTVVPWEVWEQPNRNVSPLPVPAPADADSSSISIEWDGMRISINEAGNSYEVVDAASGAVVSSGALVDLYRGPAPVFLDDDSGDLALGLAWDEWDLLMNGAYQQADGTEFPHSAEQLVLHSANGLTWVEVSLADEADTQFDSLFAVGDNFVAATVEHGEFESTRSFHTSTNGTDWVLAERRPFDEVIIVGTNDSAVIGLSYKDESSAVVTSADGRSWETGLQMANTADGGSTWLQLAATGGRMTAAIATVEPAPTPELLTITVDLRTAVFGAPGSVVAITDDRSGETLLVVTDDDAETGKPEVVTYGDGATRFWSPGGELVMTISDTEAFAAFDAQSAAYDNAVRQVVFVATDGEWFEAGLPELDDGFVAQLAVGNDVIVIGTINGDGFDGDTAPADTITVLIGDVG